MNQPQTAFAGSLFDPRLGDEWISGEITLDAFRLHFVSPSARFDIPLVRLQIEADKAAGGQILFSDEQLPDTCVSTFDQAILQHSALRHQAHTRNQIEVKWRKLKDKSAFENSPRTL